MSYLQHNIYLKVCCVWLTSMFFENIPSVALNGFFLSLRLSLMTKQNKLYFDAACIILYIYLYVGLYSSSRTGIAIYTCM